MGDSPEIWKMASVRMSDEIVQKFASRLSRLKDLSLQIAHFLRNPLSGILLNAQMMEQELAEDSPLRIYVLDILHGVVSIESMVEGLLEFATPVRPTIRSFLLHEVAEEAVQRISRQAQENHVRIVTRFAPGLPMVSADPSQVLSILLHLCRNALQAMPHGGELQIIGSRMSGREIGGCDSTWVEVEISDTGGGIPEEHFDRIFDPFFTTMPKRNGLGLSVVYRLCEINHGRLFLHSRGGEGTKILLQFPTCEMTPTGSSISGETQRS